MSMTPEEREAMGARGRQRILEEFDERLVAERYIQAVHGAASRNQPAHSGSPPASG